MFEDIKSETCSSRCFFASCLPTFAIASFSGGSSSSSCTALLYLIAKFSISCKFKNKPRSHHFTIEKMKHSPPATYQTYESTNWYNPWDITNSRMVVNYGSVRPTRARTHTNHPWAIAWTIRLQPKRLVDKPVLTMCNYPEETTQTVELIFIVVASEWCSYPLTENKCNKEARLLNKNHPHLNLPFHPNKKNPVLMI